MLHPATLPGFVATSGDIPSPSADSVAGGVTEAFGPVELLHWGLPAGEAATADDPALTVSRVVRRATGAVPGAEVQDLLARDPAALTRLLPPFGVVTGDDGGVRMLADSMGFQHLFHTEPARTSGAALSSSALIAGWTAGAPMDETANAVQSLLGWQLGQRTLFDGVRKLVPGGIAALDAAGLDITEVGEPPLEPIELGAAVTEAAALLRTSLNALLDDHPDAVLQLTGGMDSRLLLSAIPEARRRGLHAMTLEVPGAGDVARAASIAEPYGIRHDVRGLGDVGAITPLEAWELCVADSIRLDAMSDPVALAAQRIAERGFDQGVRISGLGGEIARGFYYLGRVRPRSYVRRDAERLASWRMLVNEAVEPGLLDEEFSRWAWERTIDEVYAALRAGGDEWYAATDELYLRHRMQRWAGTTDSAVADQRTVINPMLDPGFIRIARRLSPASKANSRFLALLQMELDPELGRVPLEGRPAPRAFAEPSLRGSAARLSSRGTRLVRKASQRLRRGNRPPAGGTIFAELVVQHWRANAEIVTGAALPPWISRDWLDRMLSGAVEPRPSSVTFVTNSLIATGG